MYPEYIPTDLGKEGKKKNLCKALDGAAHTRSVSDAQHCRVFAVSNCFLQKFLNQTPVVQISTFSLTLEKSERPSRAHGDDVTRSRRRLLLTLPMLPMSARGFAHFEGDQQ